MQSFINLLYFLLDLKNQAHSEELGYVSLKNDQAGSSCTPSERSLNAGPFCFLIKISFLNLTDCNKC